MCVISGDLAKGILVQDIGSLFPSSRNLFTLSVGSNRKVPRTNTWYKDAQYYYILLENLLFFDFQIMWGIVGIVI